MHNLKIDKFLKDVITKRNVDKYRRKNKIPGKTAQMRSIAMEKLETFLRQVLAEAVKRVNENGVLVKENYIFAGLEIFELKNGRQNLKCERASSAPP